MDALDSATFMDDFRPFQRRVALAGAENSLVQTTLKLTLPGVPDIYQGAELWDLSLVDPDNRRPVDYAARAASLEQLLADWQRDPAGTIREAAKHWEDGRIKLLLTALLLRLRSGHEALFAGDYLPCDVASGEADEHTGAFMRGAAGETLLVVFRRFPFARRAAPARAGVRIELPRVGAWRDLLRARDAVPGEEWDQGFELPVGVYLGVNR